MSTLSFVYLPKGVGAKHGAPINVALVKKKAIERCGLSEEEALEMIVKMIDGPVAINVFDMEAVTTTSDGVVIPGAIITMAAGDMGKIHKEFGVLHMEEIEVTAELIKEEPHLAPLQKLYPGRKLFRGPDPVKKVIPVHNVVMTGKAVNNNSATEVMNVVTMEEMLLPILGQLQAIQGGDIVFAITGGVISVGIGMTVAEKYGRVFPTRQFKAGETAHDSAGYAKTLKANIPCIVAPKEILAGYILDVLECGLIPGKELGCSPAVLSVAYAMGAKIDFENISQRAWLELESVGIYRNLLEQPAIAMTREEIIAQADTIIPGLLDPYRVKSTECFQEISVEV
ncbi:MAG: hypothetical protein CVU87_06550 [Firmicutes bacterium HGW-Firmicutes-12]|jgi:hypothetical protein|nr:MAG: hypothetical protein CVU87_06550 [Firmicutes bacterium HGW-Firmicutes-12]